MAKLYVFGIGGTGSRVIHSLTMLLASGIEIDPKFDEIVPMLIDTDENNGNLTDLVSAIRTYNKIHNTCYKGISNDGKKGHFFRTKIRKPAHLSIKSASAKNISDLIQYDILINKSPQNRALIDLLFDENIRNNELENGFLGNPNIGTIVLRDIINSEQFKNFTNQIGNEDRIFLINSIFGGTGAAGYPLLLKVFRDEKNGLNNARVLNECIIGGLTVLPYFAVDVQAFESGDSSIHSNTFLTKTKAALSYYNENILNEINALYYIADNKKSSFENHEGGPNQKNPAHFIEVAGALSIIDFSRHQSSAMDVTKLDPQNEYFCFGIKGDSSVLDFNSLDESDSDFKFYQPMTMFNYFGLFITNFLDQSVGNQKIAWIKNLGLTKDYFSVGKDNNMISDLKEFFKRYFFSWLYDLNMDKSTEVQGHQRAFVPFNMKFDSEVFTEGRRTSANVNKNELLDIVTNIPAKRLPNWLGKAKAIEMDEILNKLSDEIDESENISNDNQRFMTLLFNAMDKIFVERYSKN